MNNKQDTVYAVSNKKIEKIGWDIVSQPVFI